MYLVALCLVHIYIYMYPLTCGNPLVRLRDEICEADLSCGRWSLGNYCSIGGAGRRADTLNRLSNNLLPIARILHRGVVVVVVVAVQ